MVQFHDPDQSLTALHRKAVLRAGPLEPALAQKRERLLKASAELQKKTREVEASLEVSSDLTGCCQVAQWPHNWFDECGML